MLISLSPFDSAQVPSPWDGATSIQCRFSFPRQPNLETPTDTPGGVSPVILDSVKFISTLTITLPHTPDFRTPECVAGSGQGREVPSIQVMVLCRWHAGIGAATVLVPQAPTLALGC